MKKKTEILFLIFALALGLNAQTLTLKESLRIGMRNSKNVRVLKIKKQRAFLQARKIKAAFYPEFNLSASYTRLSNIPPFEIQTPFFPKPIKIQDPILNNYSISAGFKLPVFVGFRLVNLLKAAENTAQSAGYEVGYKMNAEAMNITKAFFNYEKSLLVRKLLKKEAASLGKRLADTKNLAAEGLALRKDLLQIKSKVEEINYKLVEAENAVIIARTVFNKALGLNLKANTNIAFNFSVDSKLNIGLQRGIAEALENRYELKAFRKKLVAARSSVQAEKGNYLPSVSVFGNYYYNKPNQRILPLLDEFKDTWAVGVALSWNIWNGGKTSTSVQIAENKLSEASTNFNLLKENIETEVTKKYFDLIGAFKKIKAAQASLLAAKENYRVTSKLYAQQKATASELLEAETNLLNAKINYKLSALNAKLKRIEFLKSLGRKIY